MFKQLWSKLVSQGDATVLKRFGKNFSLSTVGSGASALLAFARTALLAKTLPVEGYGRIVLIIDLFAFLILFLDLRIHDVIYRFYPSFEQQERPEAIATLLAGGILACLGLGVVLSGGMFMLAPWMASSIYGEPFLGPMIQVYACVAVFSAFKGFYTPILRIRDRFVLLVIPNVLANLAVVLGLLVYLIVLGRTDLFWIVAIFAGAEVIRTVPPLVVALRYEWARLWWERKHPSTLAQERPAILSTLWHTNLAGYLKLGADQGGGFLLGILSTPTQLAIYGIARQLTRPLVMLQVNVQTALAPEVFTAAARKGYPQLLRLTRRFTAMKTGVAVVLLAGAVVFAEPIVLLVASPDYLGAVPVFYLMCAMVALTFSTLTFYPLTVALDHMLRRNVVEAIRFVFIGAAVASGLDALKMTAAQFAGSATTLLGSDLFVYRDLKQRAERHASEAPDASDASEAPTPSERSASPHAPASPAAASSDVPSATTDLAS